MNGRRALRAILGLLGVFLVTLFPAWGIAQESYEPDQDWTWWDEFMCFRTACPSAPCTGPCAVCRFIPLLGFVCTWAQNE